jgi:hypothetical protein
VLLAVAAGASLLLRTGRAWAAPQSSAVYASLHTGTTAWYILAASGINPLSTTTLISAQ